MKIGIPQEVKVLEGRVALTPFAIGELVKAGHQVFIETQAGVKSGYSNDDYQLSGAVIADSAQQLYDEAKLIVKVKEPQPAELEYLREDHLLFSYLHLAAEPKLTKALLSIGLTAIAFETISKNNQLPLLAPMSDIAGRIAVQVGTHLLHQPQGGRGILLGGLSENKADAERGNVVILGGGIAGMGAARVAAAMGANVLVIEPNKEKQLYLASLAENISSLSPSTETISAAVKQADLLVGAVLIPGALAPHLVSEEMVKSMKPGSVLIDVSVDQGGCIETTRPTTYENPTFVLHDVIHFGVTNMPGAVPRTATQALSSVLLPYVLGLCENNWKQDKSLCSGINLENGNIVLPALL